MDLNFKYFRGFTNVIEMNIRTVQVEGRTRRLRARWTPEMVEEIEAFHGINVEDELTTMLSQQLANEIDDRIMGSLLPMARRVAAQTMGMDLVSVQPMGLPSGILFYMDYQYSKNIIDRFRYFRGII
jgi:ATP phosphoribosyltransferase regulatory subunit HisZ